MDSVLVLGTRKPKKLKLFIYRFTISYSEFTIPSNNINKPYAPGSGTPLVAASSK
jgi:hypothetical protein